MAQIDIFHRCLFTEIESPRRDDVGMMSRACSTQEVATMAHLKYSLLSIAVQRVLHISVFSSRSFVAFD